MDARGMFRLLRNLQAKAGRDHGGERHVVEPIPRGRIGLAVFHRLPRRTVPIQNPPGFRRFAVAAVDPVDRGGRNPGGFREAVLDPFGGALLGRPVEIAVWIVLPGSAWYFAVANGAGVLWDGGRHTA